MSKYKQVPKYFLKNIVKCLKNKEEKIIYDRLYSNKFKLTSDPIIYINNNIINDIDLKIFDQKIYIYISKIKIDNIFIEFLSLNILLNINLIFLMNLKSFIDINQFIIKIFIDSRIINYNINIIINDISNFLLKKINKEVKIKIKKDLTNLNMNYLFYNKEKINIIESFFYKSKNYKKIEFWDNINNLKNDKFLLYGNLIWI